MYNVACVLLRRSIKYTKILIPAMENLAFAKISLLSNDILQIVLKNDSISESVIINF